MSVLGFVEQVYPRPQPVRGIGEAAAQLLLGLQVSP